MQKNKFEDVLDSNNSNNEISEKERSQNIKDIKKIFLENGRFNNIVLDEYRRKNRGEGYRIAHKANRKIVEMDKKYGEEVRNSVFNQAKIKAIEEYKQNNGILPEGLEGFYVDAMTETAVKEIAAEIAAGEDKYQALKEIMIKFKKEGIELDGKEVEKRVDEILKD